MSRRLIGRIVGDRYIRLELIEDETGAPSIKVRHGPERDDYFTGVAPSHLKRLSNQELYRNASKLHEHRFTGTERERALAAEAYHEIVTEARARRQTMHD